MKNINVNNILKYHKALDNLPGLCYFNKYSGGRIDGLNRVNIYENNFNKTRGFCALVHKETLGEIRESSTASTNQLMILPSNALVVINDTQVSMDNELASNHHEKNRQDGNSLVQENILLNYKGLFIKAVSKVKLIEAWGQLKSNPGMLTKGSSDETLHGISSSWFEKTSERLINGSFKYPPARRTEIPKAPGKVGMRPLTITNPRIKIIERALLNALEPIFEGVIYWKDIKKEEWESAKAANTPNFSLEYKQEKKKVVLAEKVFSPNSFGFRPSKSAHQALHQIKKTWLSNTVYLLDYDIKKAFDNVNKNRLENIFNKYVLDPRFFQEINKMLNAGYIKEDLVHYDEVGVNQGSILSPFLFNIYMHELDEFVDKLNKQLLPSYVKRTDPGYGDKEAMKSYKRIQKKYTDNMLKTLKELGSKEKLLEDKRRALNEHYKKFGRVMGIERNNRLIQYVRYADDFLIGIVGPREFAIETKGLINDFLKSNLHLGVSKDTIVHRDGGVVTFLGHTIQLVNFNGKVQRKNKELNAIKKHKARVVARLKTQDRRLASSFYNQAKSKLNTNVNNLLAKLKFKINDKNLNLVTNILAFKEIGDAFAKTLNKKDFGEILGMLNSQQTPDTLNAAIVRWNNTLKEATSDQNTIAASTFLHHISALSNKNTAFDDISVGAKLKEAHAEFEEKLKTINNEAMSNLTKKRTKKLLETHTKRQLKKASGRLHSGLSPDEIISLKGIAPDLVEEDLRVRTVRSISVGVDPKKLIDKLRLEGYVHPVKHGATSCIKLILLTDVEIIKHFNAIMHGTLNWFSGADNFTQIKGIVETILRFSCILTLKRKFKMTSLRQVFDIYGKDISIFYENKTYSLISRKEVAAFPNKFNLGNRFDIDERRTYEQLIKKTNYRYHAMHFFKRCSVKDCTNTDIEIHHMKKLHRKTNSNGILSILDRDGKRVKGTAAVLTAINRKQLPLCRLHHRDFEKGVFHPLDTNHLDFVLNRNDERFPIKYPENMEETFKGQPFKYSPREEDKKKKPTS